MFRWLFVVILLSWAYAHDGLQTKIGWPIHYYQHGSFLGFIGVVALLILAMRLMAYTVNTSDRPKATSISLIGITLLLLAAGLVLQYLPAATAGIQFLPELPWKYTGWLSRITSSLAWCCLVAAVGISQSKEGVGPSDSASVLFLFLFLNATLSWSETKPMVDPSADLVSVVAEKQLDEPRDLTNYCRKVDHWKAKAVNLRDELERLRQDYQTVTKTILLAGKAQSETVRNTQSELRKEQDELNRQIARMSSEIATIDAAVIRAESSLRQLKRRGPISNTFEGIDAEFEELSKTQRELQDLVQSSW